VRAFCGETLGDAKTDACTAARHQCDFTCELACHREPSFGLHRAVAAFTDVLLGRSLFA
jgi:hypothetical protein